MAQEGVVIAGQATRWVAAVMETAGVFAQEEVLNVLTGPLSRIGMVLFFVVSASGIISFAVYQRYDSILYLLLGPAFFFFIIYVRIDVSGTEYRVGERTVENNFQKQYSLLNPKLAPGEKTTASVSAVYVAVDRVISYVVQRVVALIIDTKNREDITQLARERMLSRIAHVQGSDPDFLKFLAFAVGGECGAYLQKSLTLSAMSLDFHKANKLGNKTPTFTKLMGGTLVDRQDEYNRRLSDLDKQRNKKVVLDISNRKYLRSVVAGSKGKIQVDASKDLTCNEIWKTVIDIVVADVEKKLKPTKEEEGQFLGANWDGVVALVKKGYGEDIPLESKDGEVPDTQLGRAALSIASYYLKNTLQNTPLGNMQLTLNQRGTWDPVVYQFIFYEMSNNDLHGYRLMLYHYGTYVPYLQGTCLCLLSVVFPFVGILLVIPSHANYFFTWVSLLGWVKSWDIYFAVVDYCRTLMLDLMPINGRTLRNSQNYDVLLTQDPGLLLGFSVQSDPIAHMNTHLAFVGALTMAGPLVTAYFWKGANFAYRGIARTMEESSNNARINQTAAQTRSSESGIATTADLQKDAGAQAMGLQYASLAIQNPPTINGVNLADTGDGSLQRYAIAQYNMGVSDYYMLYGSAHDSGALSASTGRKMTYSLGATGAGGRVHAKVGDYLKHRVTPAIGLGTLFGTGESGRK